MQLGLSEMAAIAAGGYHSLALKNNDTVVAWGDSTGEQATVPEGLTGVAAIAAGYYHAAALLNTGMVVGFSLSHDRCGSKKRVCIEQSAFTLTLVLQ